MRLIERARALFTKRKWPGWVFVLLFLFDNIPDWKGRIEFWLAMVKQAGGYEGVIATIAGSPYFGVAMLMIGVGYLIFVGEPSSTQRHSWWPTIGWVIVVACVCIMVSAVGYSYFEFRVQQEVSQRAVIDRHVYPGQAIKIIRALKPVARDFHRAIVVGSVDNPEADGYAVEIMKTLVSAGVPVHRNRLRC